MNDTYETVTNANEINLIEAAGKCIISVGCTNVVNNIVKYTMPFGVGFWTKQVTKLGGSLIGFAVGDYISDYTFDTVRKMRKEFNRIKEEGGFV